MVVTISDFGWTGPWSERPATEFTLQAASGLTGFRGDPAGPPISIGGDLGEYMGAAWAAYGAMALRRRVARGGPGGHVEIAEPPRMRTSWSTNAAARVATSTYPCSRRSR